MNTDAHTVQVSSLDDVHSASTDNNAARSTALEHLGVIAARIRATHHLMNDMPNCISKTMDEVNRSCA